MKKMLPTMPLNENKMIVISQKNKKYKASQFSESGSRESKCFSYQEKLDLIFGN
jgi:hypothetical protein